MRACSDEKNTFGATFDQYGKAVVAEGPAHYLGRGPSCDLPQDAKDITLVKPKVATIAKTSRDRGLLLKPSLWKEQKESKLPAPG